jgi:hypothetical protein
LQQAGSGRPPSGAEIEQAFQVVERLYRSHISSPTKGGVAVSDVTRDELRLSVEASEARTDTKFARLDGKIDLLIGKIDGLNARLEDVRTDGRSTRANIWVVGLGLAALIVAAVVGLPSIFNMGSQLRDMVQKEVQAVQPSPRR